MTNGQSQLHHCLLLAFDLLVMIVSMNIFVSGCGVLVSPVYTMEHIHSHGVRDLPHLKGSNQHRESHQFLDGVIRYCCARSQATRKRVYYYHPAKET